MWQVDVPLAEFYDAIVAAGRDAHYLALLTALVREADSRQFYEDISRYWDSLHDVTGPDVLFVLAGAGASTRVNFSGLADERQGVAFTSPDAAVVASRERPLRPPLSREYIDYRPGTAPRAQGLARSQTRHVGQLRRRLAVPEHLLPCLHLSFIGCEHRDEAVTLPLYTCTVYELVKGIVGQLDETFAAIRQLTGELESLRKQSRRNARRKRSGYQIDHLGRSPQQLRAVQAILAACADASSVPNEIAAARSECFRQLEIFRGTSEFQPLQRHIDIHLDQERAVAGLRIDKQISAKVSSLGVAWEKAFRRTSELASPPASFDFTYRIFVCYRREDRWIAEHLHSALEQRVQTFLDTRCVQPGDKWADRIRAAQEASDLTVVIVGASGNTAWFQEEEYLRAIELARRGNHRIIPLCIGGSIEAIPYGLKAVQAIVTNWATEPLENDVHAVAARIVATLPQL